jgi:predicted acyltransferase (DUF342 family)
MAGYTRQDTTGQLANGNPIDADIFNDEYDAIEGAFNASSGHAHDGSAGGGAPIEDVGPSLELKVDSSAVFPKTDNLIDSGKAGLRWKTGYFGTDILVDNNATIANDASVGNDLSVTNNVTVGNNASVGNSLTVTGTTTLNGQVYVGDSSLDAVFFDAQVASSFVPSADNTFDLGAPASKWQDIYIGGIAEADSLTVINSASIGADLTVTGNFITIGTGYIVGDTEIKSTTSSTSTTTGAVVIDGGVGIAENLHVGGTLDVTGVTTLADLDTTTLDVSGAMGVDGNFDVGGTLFTVDSATGDTAVSGTLAVTGDTTVENLTVNGNTVLGDNVADTVTINTDATTHSIIPAADSTYTLGNSGVYFSHAYLDNITTSADINVGGDVVITGDLTVSGTTTTVNSTTVDIADLNITLASNATTAAAANGGGITVAGAAATMTYNSTNDRWAMNKDLAVANVYADIKASDGTTVFTAGNGVTAATFTGDVTGNVTGNVDGVVGGTTPAAVTGTTIEFGTGLTDGTITITGFVDEDNMVSDSATLIPTQQSVKAYVDNATAGGGAITASTVTATSLDLGAGTGWVIQPSGTELHFIYNGAVQAKLTSTGTFQVNDDVAAEAF